MKCILLSCSETRNQSDMNGVLNIQKNNVLYKLNTCKSFCKIQEAVKNQCLILFNACYIQVGHVTISQTFAMIFLEAQLVFRLVSTFVKSSSTCEAQHMFMPSKNCFPSCVTNMSMAFCIACHHHNGFQRTKQVII